MYKVFLDNELFYDPRIDELAIYNAVINLEENKAGSFTFTVPPTHPRIDEIKRRESLLTVYQDDNTEPLFSGYCVSVDIDFFKQVAVTCEGDLAYLNDSVQRPARYQGVTVRGLLEQYIAKHNSQVEAHKRFTVGMVTVVDANDSLYCYTNMESTMKCLKEDLVDDLGGYFRVRYANGVKYLDYLADSMHTNTQLIKLGVNLVDFKSNIDSIDIATSLIPLGAKNETSSVEGLETRLTIESVNDGKDYIYNEESVESYGWITKTVEFDDITTASALKTKGEKYLTEIQFEKVVIEATAIDLHLANSSIETFNLSDQIRVVSAVHGLDKYFRLTKKQIHLQNPEQDKFTLGKDEKLSLSARTSKVSDEVKKELEKVTPTSQILKLAQENASAMINGNGENGFVVLHENDDGVVYEILVMDTADIETATKVWRWNQNGLGYADGKDEQGQWVFGTAITMDGSIVADYITTGTMTADRINGGVLTLGGLNDTNGNMVVKDANANELARLNNDGFKLFTDNTYFKVDADTMDEDDRLAKMEIGHADNSAGSSHAKILAHKDSMEIDIGSYTSSTGAIKYIKYDEAYEGQRDGSLEVFTSHDGSVINLTAGQITLSNGPYTSARHWVMIPPVNFNSNYTSHPWDVGSDRRIKRDIETLDKEKAKEFVYNANPVSYSMIEDTTGRIHHGFIAQEIEEIAYDRWGVASKSPNDMYGIIYTELIADLFSVAQSQHEEIEDLKDRLNKLEVNNG